MSYERSDRKKGRTLGAVDIIDRAEYAELGCQGGVDPIPGSAGVELLDEEVTALSASATPATRQSAGAGMAATPGRSGWPASACRLSPGFAMSRSASNGRTRRCMAIAQSTTAARVSCRNYEAAAEAIPGALRVTVSRAFIQASATKLRELQERDLLGRTSPSAAARRSRRRWCRLGIR